MPKEKNYNPVQAQRKADKAREVRKGKADARERRDEKLARKNPDRLQKQIDDLKAVTDKGGKLSKHEEQVLDGLEKELKAVRRARDTLGDKAPSFGRFAHDARGQKRRREGDSDTDEEEDVPDDVRRIPMPRDTPPPIPKVELDRWYAKRRAKREAMRQSHGERGDAAAAAAAAAEDGEGSAGTRKKAKVEVESRTVYEAKPVVRDLRGEAVAAFVPTAVQMKMNRGRGKGGLMEPEEAERLEREGYLQPVRDVGQGGHGDGDGDGERPPSRRVTVEDVEEE